MSDVRDEPAYIEGVARIARKMESWRIVRGEVKRPDKIGEVPVTHLPYGIGEGTAVKECLMDLDERLSKIQTAVMQSQTLDQIGVIIRESHKHADGMNECPICEARDLPGALIELVKYLQIEAREQALSEVSEALRGRHRSSGNNV